jgi:hypothetical protein
MQNNCKDALKESSLAACEPISKEASRLARRSDYPTSSGHLADHIETEVAKSTPSQCLVKIGPDKDHWYGRFLETGAGAHIITATEGKLLRFYQGGAVVYAKTVHHPGTPAVPFLRPARDNKAGEALRIFGREMVRRLRVGGLS